MRGLRASGDGDGVGVVDPPPLAGVEDDGLADGVVLGDGLADGVVLGDRLADGVVLDDRLADGVVLGDRLVDGDTEGVGLALGVGDGLGDCFTNEIKFSSSPNTSLFTEPRTRSESPWSDVYIRLPGYSVVSSPRGSGMSEPMMNLSIPGSRHVGCLSDMPPYAVYPHIHSLGSHSRSVGSTS